MAHTSLDNTASRTPRRYDLDALRGLGALLVVVAHCTLSFATWTNLPLPIPTHRLFNELAWFLNPWLMPLFMLLAGASACFALRRRTNGQYLRERAGLLVPLGVGLVAFIVPSVYITRLSAGETPGPLPAFYLHFFEGIFPTGNFTFLHLWFLAYLLVYALVTLPLFRFLGTPRGRGLTGRLAESCGRRGGVLLMALPLVALQLGVAGRFPTAEYPVFVNDGFRAFTLLYFFICGYVFASDERFSMAIARQWRAALAVALVGSLYLAAVAWPRAFNPRADLPLTFSTYYFVYHTAFILCGWSWVIVCLALGRRYLAQPHPVLAYLGRASFVVYLVHPVFWLPGTFAVALLGLPGLPAFLLLVAFDAATSLGVYQALRRARSARRSNAQAVTALRPLLIEA